MLQITCCYPIASNSYLFLAQEKVLKNGMKLESHISQVILLASKTEVSLTENGVGKMLSSRTERPVCKFNGSAQGFGDKDYINVHEVVLSTSIKLPHVERLPPYTTWIFLDRYGVSPLLLDLFRVSLDCELS